MAEMVPFLAVCYQLAKNRIESADFRSFHSLFDRLFCGIAVFHGDTSCYVNSYMTTICQTEDIAKIQSQILSLGELRSHIEDLRKHGDNWGNFGVFGLAGKLFEWIGCKVGDEHGEGIALICREVIIGSPTSSLTKSKLIRSMSHELQTPINCILHMSEELISAAEMPSSGGQKCQIISSYCHFMSYLVNDMVDYAELVAGARITLRKTRVNLNQLLKNCVDMVSVFADAKKLKIDTSIDPNLTEYIRTDPSRLTQLVLNLLSNSIKYTFRGGVKLIALQSTPQSVKIIIEDSGIGIEPSKVKRIRQGYFVSDKTVPTSGIGLFLSHEIARELGEEEISIVSDPESGSSFTFWVKTKAGDVEDGKKLTAKAMESPMMDVGGIDRHQSAPLFATSGFLRSRTLKQADVLLVDDYPFNRMIVRTILAKESLSVQEAENGIVAIQLIQELHKQHKHFRLIIMDIDMPVLDGIKTTERLRIMQQSETDFILPPIIGHSAFTSQEDIDRFLAVGMQGFIPKPFIRDMAMDLIRKFLLP